MASVIFPAAEAACATIMAAGVRSTSRLDSTAQILAGNAGYLNRAVRASQCLLCDVAVSREPVLGREEMNAGQKTLEGLEICVTFPSEKFRPMRLARGPPARCNHLLGCRFVIRCHNLES